MNKRTAILLGILAVVALYWMGSRRSNDATLGASIPGPVTDSPRSWHTLIELSGNGIKQSEGFTPQSREVRISWDSKGQHAGLTIFQIYVHRSTDNSLVEVAANTAAEGKDSTVVRLNPGEHYLKVNSATRWSVKVEDKR